MKFRTLDTLRPRECAVVGRVQGDGALQQRLMELGIVGGEPVEVLRYAPLGDPMQVRVCNSSVSLRKADAAHVVLDLPQ